MPRTPMSSAGSLQARARSGEGHCASAPLPGHRPRCKPPHCFGVDDEGWRLAGQRSQAGPDPSTGSVQRVGWGQDHPGSAIAAGKCEAGLPTRFFRSAAHPEWRCDGGGCSALCSRACVVYVDLVGLDHAELQAGFFLYIIQAVLHI